MKFNMVVDFVIGLVPFVGDIADAAYKCNTKNVVLLEEELRERGRKRLKGTPQVNSVDPSLPDEFDYQDEDRLVSQNGPPPRYTSQRESRRSRRDRRNERDYDVEAAGGVAPPKPARTR